MKIIMFTKFRIWLYEHGYNDAYERVMAELNFTIEEYKTKLEYERKIYKLTDGKKAEFGHKSNVDEYGYGHLALSNFREKLIGPQQDTTVDGDKNPPLR
jgi:hypothetical protein